VRGGDINDDHAGLVNGWSDSFLASKGCSSVVVLPTTDPAKRGSTLSMPEYKICKPEQVNSIEVHEGVEKLPPDLRRPKQVITWQDIGRTVAAYRAVSVVHQPTCT
jgi:hypothetical protein